MDNKITIGIGVLAVAGVGYYLYTKNKKNELSVPTTTSVVAPTTTDVVNTPKVSTFDRDKASREFAKFAFPILDKRRKDANNGLNLNREKIIAMQTAELTAQQKAQMMLLEKIRMAEIQRNNASGAIQKALADKALQKLRESMSSGQYLNAFGGTPIVGNVVSAQIFDVNDNIRTQQLAESLVKYRNAIPVYKDQNTVQIKTEFELYKGMLALLNEITDDSDAEFALNFYKKYIELGEENYKPDLDTQIRLESIGKKYPNAKFD
jgi:hypothetical protein